jgi:hypothetical protein
MSMHTTLRFLSVTVLALGWLGIAQAGTGVADHLKCFRMEDIETPNTILTADILPADNPPFAAQNCRIKQRAGEFCTGVQKTNVRDREGNPFPVLPIGGGAAGDYFCYRLRCPKIHPRKGIPFEVRDQFGARTVYVKKPDFLCAPAEMVLDE